MCSYTVYVEVWSSQPASQPVSHFIVTDACHAYWNSTEESETTLYRKYKLSGENVIWSGPGAADWTEIVLHSPTEKAACMEEAVKAWWWLSRLPGWLAGCIAWLLLLSWHCVCRYVVEKLPLVYPFLGFTNMHAYTQDWPTAKQQSLYNKNFFGLNSAACNMENWSFEKDVFLLKLDAIKKFSHFRSSNIQTTLSIWTIVDNISVPIFVLSLSPLPLPREYLFSELCVHVIF